MAQKPGPKLDLLRHVPYFAGLTDDLLAELAAAALEKRYPRGQVIFLEGDPCAGLYVVGSGRVKIYQLSLQGREHILHQLGPGDTFNDVPALDGGPNPASAAAVTDTHLWVIPRSDLRRLAHAHPELAWALTESIARRTRHLVAIVEDLALRSVKARLAKLLLAKAEEAAGLSEIQRDQMVSQAEMAAQLGTVREMVGRALRELSDEGLITFDRHRIVITDREGLAALVDM
jgi:CRP-like cAMP-binding protein